MIYIQKLVKGVLVPLSVLNTYSEEEGKVRYRKREATDWLLDTAIWQIVWLLLEKEPQKIIDQWDKNAKNETSKSPLFDPFSVGKHVDCSCANS